MIWDTSGSERYRAITVGHYREAVGAILVCDVTDLSSFNNLDYWLEELRTAVDDDCVIAIMPNKVDIVVKDPKLRQVTEEQIKDYARVNDLIYLGDCSAKDDINVTNTVDTLVKQIYFKKKRRNTLRLSKEIGHNIALKQSQNYLCGGQDS